MLECLAGCPACPKRELGHLRPRSGPRSLLLDRFQRPAESLRARNAVSAWAEAWAVGDASRAVHAFRAGGAPVPHGAFHDRRERPRGCRAAERRDELAPSHGFSRRPIITD